MAEEDENKPFESSWNLTMSLIIDIGNYLRAAGDNFIKGNLPDYFWNLNLIRRRINPFLSNDEKEQLIKLENEISFVQSLKKNENSLSPKLQKVLAEKMQGYFVNLTRYDASIMDYLNKYKLLIKPKEDTTRLM